MQTPRLSIALKMYCRAGLLPVSATCHLLANTATYFGLIMHDH